jgi:hypothetical protein
LVGQVKIVGILMMVNGVTVALMGAVYVGIGFFMNAAMPAPPAAAGGGFPPELFLIIYGVLGGVTFIVGVFNVVAGYRVMTMRNRALGLVALFSNLLALMTGYCALTAIGMMVYGLIVLFQPDVGRAFEMVGRGATPEEAVRHFTRRYDDVRDDYDEMSDSRRQWEDERRRRRDEDNDLRLDLGPDDRQ